MAFLDKTGLERLWQHIISRLGNKVDIVEGKGLSTNDYTDAEKQKLAGIAAGADVSPTIDATLSQQGQVADAAAVGEAIAAVQDSVAQADWNENDETNPAYIQNRPFYTTDLEEYVLYDGTYTFVDMGQASASYAGMFACFDSPLVEYNKFKVGQEVTFIFDGTDYSGTIKEFEGALYLGNLSILSPIYGGELEDTGEPYLFFGGTGTIYANNGTEHTITFSTIDVEIISIPEEYIPLNLWNGEGKYSVIANNKETNKASGYYSFAEGSNTIASSSFSHAEGDGATASGTSSHAEGTETIASGSPSHAEGRWTTASGQASHAEGNDTEASGQYAHAEGAGTKASGTGSHAEGSNTKAASQYQHVQGKWNIEDTNQVYAHIVGNGTSDSARSNAHTLDWDGNAWFAGTIKVGGIGQDDTDAVEVALKSDIPEYANTITVIEAQGTCYNSATEIRDMVYSSIPTLMLFMPSDFNQNRVGKILTFNAIKPNSSNSNITEYVSFSCTEIDENGNAVTTVVKVYEDKSITVETSSSVSEIPLATSTTIGGVMPVEKTSTMTTEVGIDATGRLYTTTPTIEHISDEEIYTICNMSIVAGSEVSL